MFFKFNFIIIWDKILEEQAKSRLYLWNNIEKCLKIVKYVCISQNSNNLESNEEAFFEEAFELHLLF